LIKTGLRFFDKNNGFSENEKVLVEGPTGIGKKMLVYYFINNWIRKKKNVILINADGTDERIRRIFKRYFKTDVLDYPNFIIVNAYETKMDLNTIKKIIKGIKLKDVVVVFDSLTGYFFNTEKTYLYKRKSKQKEKEAIKQLINFCKKCRHLFILIANNDLISEDALKLLRKNATTIIKMDFEDEKGRLRRKMNLKKGAKKFDANFLITYLGIKI